MRKLYITLLISALCTSAYAQDVYDALRFSHNDYFGTARSVGMGNAMTAVGSDLGSIAINPAGSAVANHSQITLTPGVSFSATSTGMNGDLDTKSGKTRFVMPNIGVTLNFNTGYAQGLKGVTFGFIANMSDNYNNYWEYAAETPTSYAGNLADYARYNGFSSGNLNSSWDNTSDWVSSLAAKTGMIYRPEGTKEGYWGGITENYRLEKDVDGLYDVLYSMPVSMQYSRYTKGSKVDYIANMAFNISDMVYIGANIGMQSFSYTREDILNESAIKNIVYENRFRSLRSGYSYEAKGGSVYAKLGVIANPFDGFRVGLAFTTPTLMNITESWNTDMSVSQYWDDSRDAYDTTSGQTPVAENKYSFVSPLRFNVGMAYTLGNFMMVSVDYELVDYAKSKFQSTRGWQNNFIDINRIINGTYLNDKPEDKNYSFLGKSNIIRAGLEIKPVDVFALRLGYIYETSGERYYENNKAYTCNANTHDFCLGLGYDSPNSFFCDLACKMSMRPLENTLLYSDYHMSEPSPVVSSKQTHTVVMATLGWRF